MEDHEAKQLDYLLADYQAVKNEIARRSNLQRAILAALMAFYLWMLNNFSSASNQLALIVAMWGVIAIAFIFYQKEHFEIQRLGDLINIKIAGVASGILGVEPKHLLPSEADPSNPIFDIKTRKYDAALRFSVFLLIPFLATVLYILIEYNKNCI